MTLHSVVTHLSTHTTLCISTATLLVLSMLLIIHQGVSFTPLVHADTAEQFTNTDFEVNTTGWTQGDANWWLSGGISPSTVVAVYQPLFASSYANSKVNLANPGTFDATEGVAPAWSQLTGWSFNGTSQYLDSGIAGTELNRQSTSAVIKYSNIANNNVIFGASYWNDPIYIEYSIWPKDFGKIYFYNGDSFNEAVGTTSGVAAISGIKTYLDGSYINDISATWPNADIPNNIYIGSESYLEPPTTTHPILYIDGKVQVFAMYKTTLSAPQVSAITNAMNALTGNSAYRTTSIKHAGTASSKVTAYTNFNFVQSVNVGDTATYNLVAYAYTDGSAVTSSDAQLLVNGSTITTTYTDAGSGWYKLTGTVTGVSESRDYGVQVKAGKTVYLDDLSLTLPTASPTSTSATTTSSSTATSDYHPATCDISFTSNEVATFVSSSFISPSQLSLLFVPVKGVDGYTIYYGTTSSDQHAVSFANTDSSGMLSYTINQLYSSSQWKLRLQAYRGCGRGPVSSEYTIMTKGLHTLNLLRSATSTAMIQPKNQTSTTNPETSGLATTTATDLAVDNTATFITPQPSATPTPTFKPTAATKPTPSTQEGVHIPKESNFFQIVIEWVKGLF